MGHENLQPEHVGERYLHMLGLGELANEQIPGWPGKRMRDFLEICGEHATPLLVGLESLDPSDPRYEPTREALRTHIGQFIGAPES